uniref:Uncharacterized protein n=1 Tax=Moniliophthora roreri TaxID=221103 RepID=A0A0W0GCL9_MONRR
MSAMAQAPFSSVHNYFNKNAKAYESHSELLLLKTTRKAASATLAWLKGQVKFCIILYNTQPTILARHYYGTVEDSQIDSQAWLADEYAKSRADIGLCAIDWAKKNPEGTAKEYDNYWRSIDAELLILESEIRQGKEQQAAKGHASSNAKSSRGTEQWG